MIEVGIRSREGERSTDNLNTNTMVSIIGPCLKNKRGDSGRCRPNDEEIGKKV